MRELIVFGIILDNKDQIGQECHQLDQTKPHGYIEWLANFQNWENSVKELTKSLFEPSSDPEIAALNDQIFTEQDYWRTLIGDNPYTFKGELTYEHFLATRASVTDFLNVVERIGRQR